MLLRHRAAVGEKRGFLVPPIQLVECAEARIKQVLNGDLRQHDRVIQKKGTDKKP